MVAREWHSKFKTKWTLKHAEQLLTRLEQDVFPYIGNRHFPVAITTSI
ncbi:MAG: phage integrase central domain-containing protein [Gammaproteobacteria bacterium]